jgi:uncharacterized cupredoxin-like copper-binding protein
MTPRTGGLLAAAAALLALASACSSSGAGGREINITQTDQGCSPSSVVVTPGEKLNLKVKNNSSQDVFELEGIEGTKLEEFVVPEGKTRSAGYTVPDGVGTYKVKCYVPGGPSTIIELTAGGASAAPNPTSASNAQSTRTSDTPVAAATTEGGGTTVSVALADYTVTPDKAAVKAGPVRFIATNVSKEHVHELAVLKIKPDGSFDNLGEIEDIAPEQGGSVQLDLEPGAYQLACVIIPGEAGSTVDHYQQGMHTDFTVTQ